MKHEEAEQLVKSIAATVGKHVQAEIARKQSYSTVTLRLLSERRVATIKQVEDWSALQQCWSLLLEEQ